MRNARWIGPAALAALFVGLFTPFLFFPDAPAVSSTKNDIAQGFLHFRAFAVRELRAGNIPLWNPHVLAGTPFVGGFQSAVFYPPNLLYLVFPPGRGITVSLVLHLVAAALAMRAWARHHGIREPAATLSGAILGLAGPLFARVYAGHLTIVEAAPWVVVALLAVDRILDGRGPRAVLLLTLAMTMLVLVGHPQTAFFGLVTAAVYAALRLHTAARPRRALAAVPIVVAGSAAMSAVQWWVAVAEAPEAFRGRITREAAAGFSFPLDGLVTLVAPDYFGRVSGPYWGGSYPWEVTLFLGAGAVFLALRGASGPTLRRRGALLGTAAVLFVVALGENGPLFGTLYEHVPGFDRFRAWSRLSLPIAMIAALFAGAGLQRILDGDRPSPRWAAAAAFVGLALGAFGLALRATGDGRLGELWLRTSEALHGPVMAVDGDLVAGDEPRIAGHALLRGAALVLLVAGAVAFVPGRRRLAGALAALAVVHPLATAWSGRGGFPADEARFEEAAAVARARGEDARIMNAVLPNSALSNGAFDVRGYDPTLLARTSEVLETISARDDPDHERLSPTWALLRLGTVAAAREGGVMHRAVRRPPLPRLVLYGDYEYAGSREQLLARLASPGFDFRRTVLLERVPSPRPVPAGAAGDARVVAESTDRLEIEVTVPAPAVLLVTDAYHPFWIAEPPYEVLPADGMLRAVPLEAGTHRIRMEYRVPGWGAARAVSAAAWLLWIVAAAAATRATPR